MSEPTERRKLVRPARLLLLLFWALLGFYLVAGAVVSLNQRWFIACSVARGRTNGNA